MSIFESLVYKTGIVAICACLVSDYYQRHLGMAILVRGTILARDLGMTRWNCDEMQLRGIKIQSVRSFLLINVYTRSNCVDSQKWLHQ